MASLHAFLTINRNVWALPLTGELKKRAMSASRTKSVGAFQAKLRKRKKKKKRLSVAPFVKLTLAG